MFGGSLWVNVPLLVLSGSLIWWAGTRLERTADTISKRTKLGSAFTGLVLLAGATSLPEVATTVTAVTQLENPRLATHNLLGGVALQTALLVVADRVKPPSGALTYFSPQFVLLIEGVGVLLLILLVIGGIASEGMPALFSVSVWSIALLAAYVALMYLTYRNRTGGSWKPLEVADQQPSSKREGEDDTSSVRRAWVLFAGLAVLVVAGGWLATRSAEALAERTGISDAFLGATLLALATSLPELSTTVAASKSGRFDVAFSNVFGSNACDLMLLFLADVLHREGSVFAHAERSALLVASVGGVMTCLFLWGLLERDNRSVAKIGWDSVGVAGVYVAGMVTLYLMTQGG